MRVSIFCPHTQIVVGIWILADHGSIINEYRERAEMLETITDVAIQRYYDRGIQVGESRSTPDVRNS